MLRLIVALLAVAVLPPAHPPMDEAPEPRRLQVQMVDLSPVAFKFEPAEVHARPGDVVAFVQTSMIMPHNVEFRDVPRGASLDAALVGPLIMGKGAVYELAIDHRFVPGRYPFVCTPHEFQGMKGVLVVEAAEG